MGSRFGGKRNIRAFICLTDVFIQSACVFSALGSRTALFLQRAFGEATLLRELVGKKGPLFQAAVNGHGQKALVTTSRLSELTSAGLVFCAQKQTILRELFRETFCLTGLQEVTVYCRASSPWVDRLKTRRPQVCQVYKKIPAQKVL